jgi:hypothetical protein
MHGQGLFITHFGDRYQGRFHNDRFLNQSGQWVVPQVIPPDEVAAAFKIISALEPKPVPTAAPVVPVGLQLNNVKQNESKGDNVECDVNIDGKK